ncbi:hypothetical protein ACQ86G_00645 [Roseateles chitinivorans]
MIKTTLPFDLIMQSKRRMLKYIIASNPRLFEPNRKPADQRPSGKTPTSR